MISLPLASLISANRSGSMNGFAVVTGATGVVGGAVGVGGFFFLAGLVRDSGMVLLVTVIIGEGVT